MFFQSMLRSTNPNTVRAGKVLNEAVKWVIPVGLCIWMADSTFFGLADPGFKTHGPIDVAKPRERE